MGVNCDESTRVEIVEIANLVFDGKITLFQGELSDSNFEIVWKEMK
jgi:phage-related protein